MESDCEEIVDDPMEIDETIPNTSQIIERKSRDSLEDSPVITVDLNKMSPKNKDPVDIVVLDDDDEEPQRKIPLTQHLLWKLLIWLKIIRQVTAA